MLALEKNSRGLPWASRPRSAKRPVLSFRRRLPYSIPTRANVMMIRSTPLANRFAMRSRCSETCTALRAYNFFLRDVLPRTYQINLSMPEVPTPVNTIARPAPSAASTTSSSRIDPPG